MPDGKLNPPIKILIVDDDSAIRASISGLLADMGYSVRTAADGFAALAEIRMETPNVLLSDLNMPGLSGFELLSVVRRRYPTIQVIAMSGSFSGEGMSSGVTADAFYQKGCSARSLLRIVEVQGQKRLRSANQSDSSPLLRIQRNGLDASGNPYVTIVCPECLRSFPETIGGSLTPVRETHCSHCQQFIYYAIDDPVEWEPARSSRDISRGVVGGQSAQA